MVTISKKQIGERWDSLPDELRDALVSEANSDFIWKVSGEENLPESKIKHVAMLTGQVLMGFIHPEDIARELKADIGLDPKTATDIEASLNQRIFTPLRQQLDAVYAPLSKFEIESQAVEEAPVTQSIPRANKGAGEIGPKILSENFVAVPSKPGVGQGVTAPTPPPTQPIISQTAAGISLGATPFAGKGAADGGAAGAATNKPTPNKGWSQQTQQDPVLKLGVITPSVPTPASGAAASMAPKPTPPPMASGKTMSEFERLDMMKEMSPAAPKPTSVPPPAPAPAPAPVMLHQVDMAASTQNVPNFQVRTGMQNQMSRPSVPNPGFSTKPAVLEFGGAAPAPKPPAPPTPPKPPAAPQNKVIVQDFLGPQK